ncbi:ABC transporter family substrate-binding protein [Glycomyces sp. TRM65418]|uniref:ABC transporter family substrate-binding protein n=1 Tax=Glycomyces sp. TRM65418 TaxID=2867006 RepID=UPI001CE57FB0|nr:ABC transporter family substrate-binding protein [Glycomyces sp. TRM65418]MCC3763700.1 ABC transporter family substrate-binding protein [Glycomyces sp. TRM65418]QZD57679.1 ABC transporter family substrate-binding protein [Glycomyces sp. TRM65418]
MRPAQARAFALAGSAALAAAALAACGGGDGSDSGGGGGEITWAISSGWESWNENTADGNNSYLHQALSPAATTLGDFGPDAEWVYNDALLAQAPELTSESPLTVTYTLNENAQWSDGEPFGVDDFTYLWYQMSGDEAKCDQAACLPASTDWGANVASIEETADNVITMTYVDGYLDPEWQYLQSPMYPAHIAEANGFTDWKTDPAVMGESATWFAENPPTWGTGPYTPVDAAAGNYVAYEPNENYQGSVEPALDKLTMKVVEGTEAIITELRQGSIDGAWPSEFSQEELDKVEGDSAITTEVYKGSIWIHIDTNTNNRFLGDEALRQAVFTAIDNEDIIAKAYPDTDVAPRRNHFFDSESEYFTDALGETDPQQGSGDADAANALLEEAGYTTGDTLTTPDGEPVTLTFRYGEGDATRTLIGELVQASLAEIGIDVTLTAIPDGELGTVLTEGDFDLVVYGWSGTPAFTTAPQQYFGSESSSNFGKYTLEGLDEAIAKVRSTTDIAESAQFANEVEAMVVPAAFTLPLFDEPQSTLYNNGTLAGIVPNGNSQAGPMWNIQEWQPA